MLPCLMSWKNLPVPDTGIALCVETLTYSRICRIRVRGRPPIRTLETLIIVVEIAVPDTTIARCVGNN